MDNIRSFKLSLVKITSDIENLSQLAEGLESCLNSEDQILTQSVEKEIEETSDPHGKEFIEGWYSDDLYDLSEIYPKIQRDALFLTSMILFESELMRLCQLTYSQKISANKFKEKPRSRKILSAIKYLEESHNISKRAKTQYASEKDYINKLWTIRNSKVHNAGQIKEKDKRLINDFCENKPTLLSKNNEVSFTSNALNLILHGIGLFFNLLVREIIKNLQPSN